MNNKICVVGVYLGKLPNYISLWLKSAEFNPTIDFLIFTDTRLTILPPNVKCIPTTLGDIQKRASSILGFNAVLPKPYKVCDYKPLYGLIFSDYLAEYDYWGHCDFDMIFGDLQNYFDLYDLYKYDRFLSLGHLSFYRNTDEVNFRFKLSGGLHSFEEVFTSEFSFAFDELPGMSRIYLTNKFPFFYKNVFADIAITYDRFRLIDTYSLDKKNENYTCQTFIWDNGKIYHCYEQNGVIKKEERMYIHFKQRPNFNVTFNEKDVSSFFVSKFGFIPLNTELRVEDINSINPYKGSLYEYLEKRKYAFFRKLSNLKLKLKRIKFLWMK